LSRRIAYRISRTILYVAKSQVKSRETIRWIRKLIEFNELWTSVYGWRKGEKWSEDFIELRNDYLGESCFIIGVGIGGSIRGLNTDDYRPDIIYLDDILDKESVNTNLSRDKIIELVFGDIKESLEAESDNPYSQMVQIGTPLDAEDTLAYAEQDPLFATFTFTCWTPETRYLPVDEQISSWEARYPTRMLREEKRAAIAMNRLHIFTREKECELISAESAAFQANWLKTWDILPPMSEMVRVMTIDPVPPPSKKAVAEGLHKKDYEAFAVVGLWKNRFYLLDYRYKRGHEPDWTIATFFEMVNRWKPRQVQVESVAYQRTLAWLLRKAMETQRRYVAIHEYTDARSKYDKIVDGLHGPAANGALYVHASHREFIEAFTKYPAIAHDDIIEAVARGVEQLNTGFYDEENETLEAQTDSKLLTDWRSAP